LLLIQAKLLWAIKERLIGRLAGTARRLIDIRFVLSILTT